MITEMTEREKKIHDGLKSIGTEIAAFFQDAVAISKLDIESKPYLLSHLSREIESGLRDVLATASREKNEICEACSRPIIQRETHKESILNSLGIKQENELVNKWFSAAKDFHKYAHRRQVWKSPREKIAFDNHWKDFVDVLDYLVGSYYALADRVDSIIKKDPTQEIIATLPNLLKQESRLVYFFDNLKSANWLKHLYKEGYFDGASNPEPIEAKENPGSFSMPFWGVLKYLESVAIENYKTNNSEISRLLVQIIEEISTYRKADGIRIENYYTDYILFKIICSLPKGYLTTNHLQLVRSFIHSNRHNFIGHDFDKLVTRVIEEQSDFLVIEVVKTLFSYRVINDSYEKAESVFESYQLANIVSTKSEEILNGFASVVYEPLLKEAKELIPLQTFAFSTFNIPAIENHDQTSFPDKLECQIIYFLRDCLDKLPTEHAYCKVKYLLDSKEVILFRIAIQAINKRFSELEDLFWQLNTNPLDLIDAKHEIYELLKNHSVQFSQNDISKILDWVETADYYVSDESKESPEVFKKVIAYKKKEWLKAVEKNDDLRISNLVNDLNKVNNAEVAHPGFNSWHSGLIGNISPLSIDEILNMNLTGIISYYDNFNSQPHDFMGPSPEGFIDNLVQTIRLNPNSFNTELKVLKKANSIILYSWIRGLQQSWGEEKKTFQCSEVLNLSFEIITETNFWHIHNSDDSHSRWFVSTLLIFLEDGLHDDSHAFDPDLLPLIKNTLLNIYQNDKSKISEYSDLSMAVLNSSKGKIYAALLQYSLRFARIQKESANIDRWDKDIKILFSSCIDSNKDDLLLFHVLGQFLPNIKYLDDVWLQQKFNEIFLLSHPKTWAASISGYFFYHRQVSADYFTLFEQHGHFKHALHSGFELLNAKIKESIIQQICTAYLYSLVNADINSILIRSLLANKNENIYSHIIHFFGHLKIPRQGDFPQKVKLLWKTIYDNAIKMEAPKIDAYILSGCSKWVKNLTEIDEITFHILKTSVPYVLTKDRYFIIEGLEKLIKKSPESVGVILHEIYKKEITYDVSREKLVDMIKYLYSIGCKKVANNICLLHAENGYHFLRELYRENNL
jgi:hypothetical protein